MHLAFIDIARDYTADRPDKNEPLGGTNSAVCFLARELVKTGISCTLFNKIVEPAEAYGIESLPLEALMEYRANPKYSAFIFCGRWVEWLVKLVREATHRPVLAWMHESALDTPMTPALAAFDGIVFVSEWQSKINQSFVHADWHQTVIRNAMNPQFAALFEKEEQTLSAKTKPPILLYAGATPRGAFHLPPLLNVLRQLRKDFSMEIYCDCAPSSDPMANASYIDLLRSLPNISHVGMVGQSELAQKMRRASLFVSPNPWPETSCIALIEAMAAGLSVITTNRAALPETASGFAQHIAIDDPDNATRFDQAIPYGEFAETISQTMDNLSNKADEFEHKLRQQINYFNAHYQWSQRSQLWIDYIRSFG